MERRTDAVSVKTSRQGPKKAYKPKVLRPGGKELALEKPGGPVGGTLPLQFIALWFIYIFAMSPCDAGVGAGRVI